VDTARCILDNRVYNAKEFSRLDSTEIQQKRYVLACKECNETAAFCRASSKGRVAHFKAFHAEGCTLAEAEPIDGEYGENADQIENLGERIIVNFNYGITNTSA
jgi:hypothetical protein